ncbi:MAG: hypothetical protein HY898_36760 [Deltaproteobacteria bacterium]|nr:hypothetical protein [Deltaproteobacteria bacterium]
MFGCGSDDPPPAQQPPPACSVLDQTGCAAGQVCEETAAGTGCFAPVHIKGHVFDAMTTSPIAGARVVLRDANESVVSKVAVTAADGTYDISAPAKRDANGKPISANVTLRADAQGYLGFPKPPRVALPVDVSTAQGDPLTIASTATDIALIPLQNATGTGWISGTVKAPHPGGTLIVAGGSTGVADADGAYEVFNVAAGAATVRGYGAGLQLAEASATVEAGKETPNVDLTQTGEATAVVSGNVQIVNAPGGSSTSVVLAVEETFQESVIRGEVPKGLRAANVSGAFSIAGVPSGRYVVLAAFENDGLVRDPDTSIGGTEIVHITVAAASMALSQGFKVTGALAVNSPGANGPEEVSGTPTFSWEDDSSEDTYTLQVFDAFGNEVWKQEGIVGPKGSKPVTAPYAGPALTPAMYYQFRATSIKDGTPISSTEDLKGVFVYR